MAFFDCHISKDLKETALEICKENLEAIFPVEMEPYDMIAVGYSALHPSEKFMRDPKKMVHYDDCGQQDFRDENEVRDFVRRTRNWTIGTHSRKAEEYNHLPK